jgi:hypothetical protein
MFLKEPADLTVLRGLGDPFTVESDGRIANQLRVKITNRRADAMAYTIIMDSLGTTGARPEEITVVTPDNPMQIASGATKSTTAFVLLPARAFAAGEKWIWISVSDARGYHETVKYRLLGPTGGVTPSK